MKDKTPIHILIADDHQMFIDGVKSLLRKEKHIRIIAEANTGEAALELIAQHPVELLITDINMPGMGGIELTRKVKSDHPHIKVIALTMYNDSAIISGILHTEAEGYILKNTGKQELLNAIEKIMDNGTYYSNEVVSIMLQKKNTREKPAPEKKELLSQREIEIVKLICSEYSTAAIAEKLFISPRTVDTHRKNILEKTQVKTLVGLIKYAFDNELINWD
jgi:DNA-binding NarL/FixJ family response regulator